MKLSKEKEIPLKRVLRFPPPPTDMPCTRWSRATSYRFDESCDAVPLVPPSHHLPTVTWRSCPQLYVTYSYNIRKINTNFFRPVAVIAQKTAVCNTKTILPNYYIIAIKYIVRRTRFEQAHPTLKILFIFFIYKIYYCPILHKRGV